jgi:hypothetical protein
VERAERRPDGARAARLAEDRRHLPVGHDLAARDAADEAVDEATEGRARAPAAR